jgi:CHAD domain-containing protein
MADGKWIEGLMPATPVPDAARAVLTARFEVVRQYLPLAAQKAHEDVEHVHQLRVGTRRAAAALRAFAEALPRKALRDARRALRTIRRAAGDARDWDVFLQSLAEAKPLATTGTKPARDFLLGFASGERAAAQERLAAAAAEAGPLFAEQCDALPLRTRAPVDEPAATFGELAARRIGALLREFTAGVEANPTEPPALHALRIVGKRVRYAIEIFAECFPPVLKESIYPAVEHAQEMLGGIQDATVGTERLAAIRVAIESTVPQEWPRIRKGIEALSESLRARVPRAKKEFAAWRAEWLELMKALRLEVVAATVTG